MHPVLTAPYHSTPLSPVWVVEIAEAPQTRLAITTAIWVAIISGQLISFQSVSF